MQLTTSLVTAASLCVLALAAPTKTIEKRADYCGLWDSVQTGGYSVYNNLWGYQSGTGSQCFGVDSLSGKTLKWHTSWSWAGNSTKVKSYANVVVTPEASPLSKISSIPSSWSYTQTGSNLVADISYDMFTSSTFGGAHQYEVMIWLAALGGANPISTSYNAQGAVPVATGLTIAGPSGTKWNLYKGPNGSTTVFSFVVQSEVTNFSGDLMAFFKYLEAQQGLLSSQYIQTIGAGTEPFTGSNAELTVTGYSTTINYT